jgi:hypothetical protein
VKCRPPSSGWYLSDIAKAHVLLKETGWDAVLSRNTCTSQPDALHLLQRLCSEGKQLRAKKNELVDKLSFAVEVSVEALSDAVSTIRAAGMFRIFSPRYRRAKSLFRSIARASKYGKRQAVETLEALIEFRKREAEFNRHPYVTAIFGLHFRGIETDLDRFDRLARFYTMVDSYFNSPDRKSLRLFLRDADTTELELLPPIPPIEVVITYDSLQERIEAAEADIRTLQEGIPALRLSVHVFCDPKSVRPSDLVGLMDSMRAFLDEEAALDECSQARLILDSAFKGSRTLDASLDDVIQWALAAKNFAVLLSPIMAEGKTAQARSAIGEVLKAERTAQEFLNRVAETAKIEVGHLVHGLASSREKPRVTLMVFSVIPSLPLFWRRSALRVCFRSSKSD